MAKAKFRKLAALMVVLSAALFVPPAAKADCGFFCQVGCAARYDLCDGLTPFSEETCLLDLNNCLMK